MAPGDEKPDIYRLAIGFVPYKLNQSHFDIDSEDSPRRIRKARRNTVFRSICLRELRDLRGELLSDYFGSGYAGLGENEIDPDPDSDSDLDGSKPQPPEGGA